MIGPTDLHSSPVPHFRTFQMFQYIAGKIIVNGFEIQGVYELSEDFVTP
jgi:hypothetical protein